MKSWVPLIFFSVGVACFGAAGRQAPKRTVSYDRDIVPILSRCFKCHGPDAAKAAGGLRLDSFIGATKDGVIVPGSPQSSLIIKRVSSTEPDMQMPPSDSGVKRLSAEQIATLREWISQGAKYEKHWSYVPPVMPSLPKVADPGWCRNPIDRFVLAKLEDAGLKPEPEADRDTLALRAAETLTGLSPTLDQLDTFRRDKRPGAYERFVDRLLASPAYGEHQARYWLDAVRYGDTHGLQLDNERGVYPYRDWVVRAYNEDLPFSKFVEWQLAGDLLPNPTTEQLIATGYVRMNLTSAEGGAIPEEFLARNTFDRVDTTSTVFLGMTVQCAKCHDHKFDPVKQSDYYGLYAFFDSTKDEPLDGNVTFPPPAIKAPTPADTAAIGALDKRLAELRAAVQPSAAFNSLQASIQPEPESSKWQVSPVFTEKSFDEAFDKPEPAETNGSGWKPFPFVSAKSFPGIIGKDSSSVYVRGVVTLGKPRSITFGVSSDDAVKVWLNGKLIHSNKVSRGVDDAVDRVTGKFQAGENHLLVKVVNGAGPDGLNIRLFDLDDKVLADTLSAFKKAPENAPAILAVQSAYLERGPESAASREYKKAVKARADLEASIPMTLVAQEMDKPRPTFILLRGLYDQKGAPVQRHVPASLGQLPPGAPANRLGFARWLTSPSNPLLARVYVNRIWQQLFGTGLVKTADDFGSQGEWPIDQPLLDYLAVSFERNGWSLKRLNKLIVTSGAFRQSSRISKAKLQSDPENRLISRGPRFRLDAEVIRDKALDAGGLLVEQLGGRGFKPYQPDGVWEAASDPASATHFYKRDTGKTIYRRSMYLFWKRTAPPPAMVNLDAPLRDTCVVRRSTTDTPLQALTLLNEPGYLEASRTMAVRLLRAKGDDKARLLRAFDLTLARLPRPNEVALLSSALASYRHRFGQDVPAAKKLLQVGDSPQDDTLPASELASWMLVCSTLMNTDEFLTLH